ncbi:MAG: flavin reductase family protein [Steroidobacteraceae bacterium]|jgi:flavin reductase (DIM6/NTAB) family NADH-FMN oxidoreductase RutF
MSADIVALFRRITLGVYIIGVAHETKQDAFTAAAVIQASYDPLLLALAINPKHASYRLLHAGGYFTVSVLAHNQLGLARRFGASVQDDPDKMLSVSWRRGHGGTPILADALGFFDCSVRAEHAAGDHRIVLGEVTDGAILVPAASPLLYADTDDMDGSAALYPSRLASDTQ